ncbi:hypothetical protein BC829DRAFT_39476 [Chytridium lagenaria]|nr:hypothetical protein BC829DRAFT_39476 [Chytridium lagenaria]
METTTNDDLLFFVRLQDPSEPEHPEPIFVKRKVNKTMPSLTELIDWKQTFFLNLIIQLPCTLTVAVCRRSSTNADGPKKKSLLTKASSERVVVVGGATSSTTGEEGTELQSAARTELKPGEAPGSPYGSNASLGKSGSPGSSPKPTPRSRMIALRRITKKVYAAPYKSRMDIKDAFMNEISYPLVYYTVQRL